MVLNVKSDEVLLLDWRFLWTENFHEIHVVSAVTNNSVDDDVIAAGAAKCGGAGQKCE